MAEQFAFLGDKCKAAIAAMSLGVLLLLPGSLGYGGTIIIQEAFGQFNLPLLEDEEAVEEEEFTVASAGTIRRAVIECRCKIRRSRHTRR